MVEKREDVTKSFQPRAPRGVIPQAASRHDDGFLANAGTVDNAKLEAIKTDLKNLSAQTIDEQVARALELKQILTPEQFQKMQSKMEGLKGKFGGKWGGKGKDNMPPPPEGSEHGE